MINRILEMTDGVGFQIRTWQDEYGTMYWFEVSLVMKNTRAVLYDNEGSRNDVVLRGGKNMFVLGPPDLTPEDAFEKGKRWINENIIDVEDKGKYRRPIFWQLIGMEGE